MTDHVHTFTDHGPTSMGGTWERCPCGLIRVTADGGTVEVQQPPDPEYPRDCDAEDPHSPSS